MMSTAHEILSAIETAVREKDFDSDHSIVRLNKQGWYIFEWTGADVKVKGDLLDTDSIGLSLGSLEISKDLPANTDIAAFLKTAAEAIEHRINYLMEQLKIVELDTNMKAVQIRSEQPEFQDGMLSYYEFLLRAGKWFGYRNHVALHRYSQMPDGEPNRQSIAFPLTKKQFQKLIDDLLEIL
jgi:hypothetical protein